MYATGRSAYYVRIPAITCRGDRSSQGQHRVTFLTFLKLFKFLCHCHPLLFMNLPSSPPTSLNPVTLVSSDFLQFSSSQSVLRVPWGMVVMLPKVCSLGQLHQHPLGMCQNGLDLTPHMPNQTLGTGWGSKS